MTADPNAKASAGPIISQAAAEQMLAALRDLLALIEESRGVAGYHLNGEIAEWDEFPEVAAIEAAVAAAEAR